MRVAANPILVAVALGLLGPVALDDEDEDVREAADSSHALESDSSAHLFRVLDVEPTRG